MSKSMEIMVLQINKFETCEVSGSTDLTLTWDVGKGPETETHTFTSPGKAQDYVFQTAKDAVCVKLEGFLRAIARQSAIGVEYWHTEGKEQAYKWLWRMMPELVVKDLESVCKNILHFKDKLWQIMPGEKHRSYKWLKDDLESILDFARRNQEFSISKNKAAA